MMKKTKIHALALATLAFSYCTNTLSMFGPIRIRFTKNTPTPVNNVPRSQTPVEVFKSKYPGLTNKSLKQTFNKNYRNAAGEDTSHSRFMYKHPQFAMPHFKVMEDIKKQFNKNFEQASKAILPPAVIETSPNELIPVHGTKKEFSEENRARQNDHISGKSSNVKTLIHERDNTDFTMKEQPEKRLGMVARLKQTMFGRQSKYNINAPEPAPVFQHAPTLQEQARQSLTNFKDLDPVPTERQAAENRIDDANRSNLLRTHFGDEPSKYQPTFNIPKEEVPTPYQAEQSREWDAADTAERNARGENTPEKMTFRKMAYNSLFNARKWYNENSGN